MAVYKVIIPGGERLEFPELTQARATCVVKNNSDRKKIAVFKNGDDFYLTTRAEIEQYAAAIEKETGAKSQICSFSSGGDVVVPKS